MPNKSVLTIIPILSVYGFLSLYRPGGLMAYALPITCWSLVALITLRIHGHEKIRSWFNKSTTLLAAITAALQIVTLIFVSFFTGFGKSPYAFTPAAIIINIAYFSSALIALELSRAYLIKSFPKRKIFVGIALTALFYTLITLSPARLATLSTPVDTIKFLGSTLLPTLAQSLLATYLALIGGPIASTAYLGTLQAFEWLSPILPNPSWTTKALIDTLIPAIGFLAINETVKPFTLMRLGIISRTEALGKKLKPKRSFPLGWTAIAVIAVILLWSSTGLLGFQPNVIASGSMTPTLNVGDIAITIQTPPETINIGDVIQYRTPNGPIIHRVIEKYESYGSVWFVTKGDANNAPDDPIDSRQVIGKVILTIPQIGWVSITIKEAAATTYNFLATTLPQTLTNAFTWTTTNAIYITSALALTAYAYLLLAYKNRKKEKKT